MKFGKLVATTAALAFSATTLFAGADIFVIGGKPDDPFWSRVKMGAEDAGKVAESQGGSVTWLGPQNYDNLGPDAASPPRGRGGPTRRPGQRAPGRAGRRG